jgi:hypothetical protein
VTGVLDGIRDVFDRLRRIQGVDGQGLAVAHGSFTGW